MVRCTWIKAALILRIAVIGGVLTMTGLFLSGAAWARGGSTPDPSPHLQRPPDIPLERLDRTQRLPIRLNVNTASPHQLQRLSGLSETDVKKVIQGRPYEQKNELVTREILSEGAYDKIKDQITVE
ncbi:MAG TPA: helix-hairpin-helix domain-containing protein [Nitrospira sp.]|nr:helix-hairpin-helix domain-containing protein [Nitrospira sp.]